MGALFLPDQFAYLQFHLVIIGSLFISKLFYKSMVFISVKKYLQILPVIFTFIIWDILVTDVWWSFNPQYIVGLNSVLNLPIPIEEVSFFFVVPFALLTFVENLKQMKIMQSKNETKFLNVALRVAKLFSLIIGYYSFINSWWYTFVISLLLLFTDFSALKKVWVQTGFYFLLFTTFIFNYYLTYLPIVLYTQEYKSNILIGTIPVEDFGYAIVLFLWILNRLYANKKT